MKLSENDTRAFIERMQINPENVCVPDIEQQIKIVSKQICLVSNVFGVESMEAKSMRARREELSKNLVLVVAMDEAREVLAQVPKQSLSVRDLWSQVRSLNTKGSHPDLILREMQKAIRNHVFITIELCLDHDISINKKDQDFLDNPQSVRSIITEYLPLE